MSTAKMMLSTSTPTSTSTHCPGCGGLNKTHQLVNVYDTAYDDYDNSSFRMICGFCLVGCHIPVVRPSAGKWEFGKVVSYNAIDSRNDHYEQPYRMQFTDGIEEWVSVSTDPYEAYTQYFCDILDVVYSRKTNSDYSLSSRQEIIENQASIMEYSNQYQCHYRQYSHSNKNASIDHSVINHFGSLEEYFDESNPPVDRTQILSDSPFFSLENLDRDGKVPCVNSLLTKPVQNQTFSNMDHYSLVTQEYSTKRYGRIDSPISSRITNSPFSPLSCHKRNNNASYNSSAHRIPRLWTTKEDKLLLASIALKNNQFCWPKIAMDISGRTGKQCRERYLNHLGPHLKRSGWSALEDATIFRLYASQGSKWSQIAKSLPGRTDNGIKNRFHHLRRRFEKRMKYIPDSKELRLLKRQIEKCPPFWRPSPDSVVTRDIAVRILVESSFETTRKQAFIGDGKYKFGPFDKISENAACDRCGLIVPSKMTGIKICRHTGWCETCTRVSLVVSGDFLRAVHSFLDQMRSNARTMGKG